jgi:hypothetical protein
VYVPILKKQGRGKKSQWVLAWRPAVAADLRHIWNGDINLDNASKPKRAKVSNHYRQKPRQQRRTA